MPMPHRTQMQLIKRRLVGKEGSERIRELRTILTELPDYRNGPYADLRKWVNEQIDQTRTRSRVVHRDSISVRKEGAAQIALVGPPNAGKSSLLQALTDIQIKVDDYAFTTLRPVASLASIYGVPVQLVEIPGLISGATEDRGGGRALLGVLRGADAIVYCHDAGKPISVLEEVRSEVAAAGIELPSVLAVTKIDDYLEDALARVRQAVPDMEVVGVSILDDDSLNGLREVIWRLTGLIRVYLKHEGEVSSEPVALRQGATVEDVAASIHNDLVPQLRGACVWGSSAKFDGQLVGRSHVVLDGDVVEVLA